MKYEVVDVEMLQEAVLNTTTWEYEKDPQGRVILETVGLGIALSGESEEDDTPEMATYIRIKIDKNRLRDLREAMLSLDISQRTCMNKEIV